MEFQLSRACAPVDRRGVERRQVLPRAEAPDGAADTAETQAQGQRAVGPEAVLGKAQHGAGNAAEHLNDRAKCPDLAANSIHTTYRSDHD